jgi:hypothetical protein
MTMNRAAKIILFKILFFLPGLLFIILISLYGMLIAAFSGETFYIILAPLGGLLLSVTYALMIFWTSRRKLFTGIFFLIAGILCFSVAGKEIYRSQMNSVSIPYK